MNRFSSTLSLAALLAASLVGGTGCSILGDEAMHWAVLRQALGQPPVPSAFVS